MSNSPKASSQYCSIQCFFLFPVSSLFLKFIHYSITSSSSSSRHFNPSLYLPSIMWPIQLVFLLFIACRLFLSSLNLRNTSSFFTRSLQLIFSILLQHCITKLLQLFLIHFAECPSFSTTQRQCTCSHTIYVTTILTVSICTRTSEPADFYFFSDKIVYRLQLALRN